MNNVKLAALIAATLGAGTLFGFYFTMSVSIMPGFDLTEPYAAITANQDIGRATQKSLFFVALPGMPVALLACIAVCWKALHVRNWLILTMAGWIGMMVVTVTLNEPLNQILDGLTITSNQGDLADLWASYSVDWQRWNWLRVLTSGISLVAIAIAIRHSSFSA